MCWERLYRYTCGHEHVENRPCSWGRQTRDNPRRCPNKPDVQTRPQNRPCEACSIRAETARRHAEHEARRKRENDEARRLQKNILQRESRARRAAVETPEQAAARRAAHAKTVRDVRHRKALEQGKKRK